MLLKNKRITVFLFFILLILVLISILVLFKVVSYTFITGYILGSVFLYISFTFMKISIKDLATNLNPYNFMFFLTLRIGFYIVPFLISFYLPNIFSIYALLMAFLINWIPLIFINKSK
ncbi:MG406 family protein [Spiroplasma endosymbiont of Atherix ibis]|uniref:MG406 family protein n=1 Tax=Spiroplasma endosymbiont of Atherix ibis TaxID=3066291 RepID=UPI003BB160DC